MWFEYRQNNSGGSFRLTDKSALYVFVEADTAKKADDRVEMLTSVYFDPRCEIDCSCCGSRWDTAYDGKETIEIDKYLLHGVNSWCKPDQNAIIVVPLVGEITIMTRDQLFALVEKGEPQNLLSSPKG